MDAFKLDDLHCRYDKHLNHRDDSLLTKTSSRKMQSNSQTHHNLDDPCRVCGFGRNTGRNFGVITCSTCKAFFRRNGRNILALPPCRFGGKCPVNERTRRQCPTCRLAKCFAVGMQKDLIRTDEERAARLQLVRANRLQRHEKHHHKPTRPLSYDLSDNTSVRTLSSTTWSQLTSIRSAYEHFCLHPILRAEEEREEYLNTQPIKCRLKEHSFLNALNVHRTSLSSFLRATISASAGEINGKDWQWLVRTNLRHLLLFLSMDLMQINGNQLHFDSKKACHNVYLYVYGQDLLTRAEDLIHTLNTLIGFDPITSKLLQIILFLSPPLLTSYLPMSNYSQPSSKTIRLISALQEKYIQSLWSYFVYRFGEMEATKVFVLVIGQVLQQQMYGADVDKSLIERQPFGNLVYALLTSSPME